MRVCKELGLTLEQGFELTELELKLWFAFFKMEKEAQRKWQQKHTQ